MGGRQPSRTAAAVVGEILRHPCGRPDRAGRSCGTTSPPGARNVAIADSCFPAPASYP